MTARQANIKLVEHAICSVKAAKDLQRCSSIIIYGSSITCARLVSIYFFIIIITIIITCTYLGVCNNNNNNNNKKYILTNRAQVMLLP